MNIIVYEEQLQLHFWWDDLLHQLLFSCGIEVTSIEVERDLASFFEGWTHRGSHQFYIFVLYGSTNLSACFQLAHQIRQEDPLATMVIVADTLDLMELVFASQIGFLDYLYRDLPEPCFRQRLARLCQQVHANFLFHRSGELILIQNASMVLQLPVKKVYAIERSSRPHYLSLVTQERELSMIANLQDVKEMSPFLFACHRSILVNPFNIQRIDRQLRLAWFPNGYSCPISRNRMPQLLQMIMQQDLLMENSTDKRT